MPDDANSTPPAAKTERLKQIALPSAVLALTATPSGDTVFAACQDGGVFTVDTAAGKAELLGQHSSYASGVALLPDGRTLISAGYDGVIQWHDLPERRSRQQVAAHAFWSWDLAVTRDGSLAASVTGRYEAGGYKYEPAPEREPSVKVFDARTGQLRHQFTHVPPVQAVAFSPDGQFLAAGNLMGQVRVWDVTSGDAVAQWWTPDFTSWGVIKSHHYLGGIFAMTFSPDGQDLLVTGMGPMRDPMAGNGLQRWQRFHWRDGKKLGETREDDAGRGLMEALSFHPSGRHFVMAGRLTQGKWNLAIFEAATGALRFSTDAKHRITDAVFSADGSRLFLAKAKQQERKDKDGRWPDYGAIEVWSVNV